MKLKGIELRGTYKVNFDNTWFEVFDEKGNRVYLENSYGYWSRHEYGEKGYLTLFEDSSGLLAKWEYDEKGNQIYFEIFTEISLTSMQKN